MTKATAIKTIEKLPKNFTIDELVEQLIFIEKVEAGLKDVADGKIYSTKEARKKLKKWSK